MNPSIKGTFFPPLSPIKEEKSRPQIVSSSSSSFIGQLRFEFPFISIIETIAAAWLSPRSVSTSFIDDRIRLPTDPAIKGSFVHV